MKLTPKVAIANSFDLRLKPAHQRLRDINQLGRLKLGLSLLGIDEFEVLLDINFKH